MKSLLTFALIELYQGRAVNDVCYRFHGEAGDVCYNIVKYGINILPIKLGGKADKPDSHKARLLCLIRKVRNAAKKEVRRMVNV